MVEEKNQPPEVERKKEDKTKKFNEEDKTGDTNNNNNINSEQNLYTTFYIKFIYKQLNNFKNNVLKYIINICQNANLKQICSEIYNEIIESLKVKNEITLEPILFNIENDKIIDGYLKLMIYNCDYVNRKEFIKLKNQKELDNYLNELKKVPVNVFRVLFYENIQNEIAFADENSAVFSIMINLKYIESEKERLYDCFQKKVNMVFLQKCANIVNKNIFFYNNDKEYLNIKNLKDKIYYDLKKSSFTIKTKIDYNNSEIN